MFYTSFFYAAIARRKVTSKKDLLQVENRYSNKIRTRGYPSKPVSILTRNIQVDRVQV